MKGNVTFLNRSRAGLMVIDVQDCLVAVVDRSCEVIHAIAKAVKGCRILGLPIVVTEQYPKGLGHTTAGVQAAFLEGMPEVYTKTSFSCLGEEANRNAFLAMPVEQWILVGFEAHICVLQTAKDLKCCGKEVIVLNDAITSRSIFDFSTAIAEMRDMGVRVTSTETALFELVGSASSAEFKAISQLVK